MTSSLDYAASASAETQRSPAAEDGKVGPRETYLEDLLAVPPWPLSQETALKYALKSPRRGFKTALAGALDIRDGDSMTIAGRAFNVKAVDVREANGELHTEVVLEEISV
jgi:hypothetical protein